MATFFMFGRYSTDALKGISSERTDKAADAVGRLGGKVQAIYALLGNYDLVFIADFPGVAEAMKVSIELTKLTGISFTTLPAIPVDQFDKIMSKP